jgi:hypothetical protein
MRFDLFRKEQKPCSWETGDARLMKTDILKGLMFYTVKGSGTFYPISLENVKMVLEMNANGKKPADITDLAEAEEKNSRRKYRVCRCGWPDNTGKFG